MPGLRQLQKSFFDHLLGAHSNIVERIESTPDTSAQQRLDIYASGYRLRLKEAISTDYERLHFYLGDDLFYRLVDCYIDKYNSSHPSLRYYSQHMLELIQQTQPFSDIPEVFEIATIEQAFNDSFDAANCSTISNDQLAEIDAEAWPSLRLQFHSSVRLLSFEYNSFPIWKALSVEQTPPTLEKDASHWLVWRKGLVSRYRTIDDAERCALGLALNGGEFGNLCEGLLDYYDEQTTPQKAIYFLQGWITEKMICNTY